MGRGVNQPRGPFCFAGTVDVPAVWRFTPACEPIVCEMAYAAVDGMIMLTSRATGDKVKALRRNPAISICFQGAGLQQVMVREMVNSAKIRDWCGGGRGQLVLIVHVEKMRTFDVEKMFRAERAAA
jgi:hypothetical protein